MKHSYRTDCACRRCAAERTRRARQAERTTPEVMLDSRNPRRRRAAEHYWDAYQSGRPMSSDDY